MGDMIRDAAKHFKAALTGNGNDLKTFSSQLAYLPPIPLPVTHSQTLSETESRKASLEGDKPDFNGSSDTLGLRSPPQSLIVQLRSENMANKAKDIKLFALLEVSSSSSYCHPLHPSISPLSELTLSFCTPWLVFYLIPLC